MTNFLLIRHGATDAVGRSIAGRTAGTKLNEEGHAQAERLAARLAGVRLAAAYSSPLERARETAEPFARRLGVEVRISEAFNEIDFGEWTNRTLAELDAVDEWQRFNSFRGGTRIPGGELMLEAQARAVAGLENLRQQHREETIAVVSHGDIIRAVLAHYAGVHLDLFQRIEISPASVSVVAVDDYGPQVLLINDTGELPI